MSMLNLMLPMERVATNCPHDLIKVLWKVSPSLVADEDVVLECSPRIEVVSLFSRGNLRDWDAVGGCYWSGCCCAISFVVNEA